jgi:nucleoside-triphosphatase THEP1
MRTRELTLLTGEVDSGKTSWCLSFLEAHPGYDGLLLKKVYQSGRRIGYDAVRISSGQTVPFSRLKGSSEQGRNAANRWLVEALDSSACGLIVDEIGPLEIEGGGLAEAVRFVLENGSSRSLILVVRRGCLELVIQRFSLPEHRLVEL